MRGIRRAVLSALIAAAAMFASAGAAQAVDVTHHVHATAEGSLYTSAGTEFPMYLGNSDYVAVSASVRGGGLLHGQTEVSLSVGFPVGNAPEILTVYGWLTVLTPHGFVGAGVVGAFNTDTGELSLNGAILDGDGKFSGASGALHFHGQGQSDGSFVWDDIEATIALAVPTRGG